MTANGPDAVEAHLLDAGLAVRKVFLRQLRLDIAIGVHESEHQAAQPVMLDITLYLRDSAGPVDDRLDEVFDYDQVRSGAIAVAMAGHIHLQETLVERICAMCLQFVEVEAVRVASQKTAVYADTAGVGYEVVRFADG
jgi:dihydroneopterin aldolase